MTYRHRRFEGTSFLHHTLNMYASDSSTTPLHTYQTIRRHIPENRNLNIYRCENLNLMKYQNGANLYFIFPSEDKSRCLLSDGKCIWRSCDRASWYISYNEIKLDALISQTYSWNETLHVSDSSSVHHQ